MAVSSPSTIGAVSADNANDDPDYGPGSTAGGSLNLNHFASVNPAGEGAPNSPLIAAVNGAHVADVGINAVIVSGAPTPWEAIGKVAGVRNVVVTGGIIALGDSPLAKPPPAVLIGTANSPPLWLKLVPELRYLNGQVFPPVVPNVIDVRTVSYTEEAVESPPN